MRKNIVSGIFYIIFAAIAITLSIAAVYFAWIKYYGASYPTKYPDIVSKHSASTNVPQSLIYAVIRTESGFDPDALSTADARGLMQITPDTFEWIRFRIKDSEAKNFDDLFDSDMNIRYGSELLRLHLNEFGSEKNALCAYHAGRDNVLKWLKDPDYTFGGEIVNIPISETRHYVDKVLKAKQVYDAIYKFEGID